VIEDVSWRSRSKLRAARVTVFSERSNKKSHQGFSNQALGIVSNVAIHNGDVPADAHHARSRNGAAAFHRFQKIDLHLDGRHARAFRRGHVRRKSSRGISQRREHSTVNDSVQLQMPFINRHANRDVTVIRFDERKSELPRDVALRHAAAKFRGGQMHG
jgi:hypothetical protein